MSSWSAKVISLLILFHLLFSYPPFLEETISHNEVADLSLSGFSVGESNPIDGSVSILGASPVVDGGISPRLGGKIYLGHRFIHMTTTCTMEFLSDSLSYDLTFSFLNHSKTVHYSGDADLSGSDVVSIPFDSTLLNSSYGNVSIILEWNYSADFSSGKLSQSGCVNQSLLTYALSGNDSISLKVYPDWGFVYGIKPAFGEVIEGNGRIWALVFSGSPIYSITAEAGNASLLFFPREYFVNKSGRIWTVYSLPSNNSPVMEEIGSFNPFQLDKENRTYLFFHLLNLTYFYPENHTVSVSFEDAFGGSSFNHRNIRSLNYSDVSLRVSNPDFSFLETIIPSELVFIFSLIIVLLYFRPFLP